ncbi:hypothetical protein L218DRAFT_961852 [Marasmius fiardii PR-910]|nr:hypothetical protein L218DRAFT_961852 [Marasmius fiardii PR-910]
MNVQDWSWLVVFGHISLRVLSLAYLGADFSLYELTSCPHLVLGALVVIKLGPFKPIS